MRVVITTLAGCGIAFAFPIVVIGENVKTVLLSFRCHNAYIPSVSRDYTMSENDPLSALC